MEAAKAWMDLNQLGRRNLTKEKRDEMIRRLASSGRHTQKEIAQAVGLEQPAISKIVNRDIPKEYESTINAVSPAAEIEALQRKLEEAEGHCGEGRNDRSPHISNSEGEELK